MHSRQIRSALAAALVLLVLCFPPVALAQDEGPEEAPALSPYWEPDVQRWAHIITHYAQRRRLDPDLIAAVIWKESLGHPKAHSPAGAVGLMMLMPFPWRPSVRELENPWINIAWGTRTLAQVIRDGKGDLYYALAAYNGSWEKVGQTNTRRYAAEVLGLYARAIAVRYGLPAEGDWTAIFATEGTSGTSTVTVLGPQRPCARYTARPLPADIPSIPEGMPPTSIVAIFRDEYEVEHRVKMWLVLADRTFIIPSTEEGHFAMLIEPNLPEAFERLRTNRSIH